MHRNDVIRLVVSEGARADFYLNQRLRESYRAAPQDGDKKDDNDAGDTTVGARTARFSMPVAMAGMRARREH
jgi:fructose-1-phosphate kinase PfkB-like protein